jgi:hypothetical protein
MSTLIDNKKEKKKKILRHGGSAAAEKRDRVRLTNVALEEGKRFCDFV